MLNLFSSLLNKNMDELSKSEIEILKVLNDNAHEIPKLTLTELSKKVYVSTSSIYRLIKKLGYEGFPEFKYKVSDSLNSEKLLVTDSKDYLKTYINEIMFTYQINEKNIQDAASLILQSNKKIIFGTGWKQKEIADNFSSDMLTYGEDFITLRNKDDLFNAVRNISDNDVLIFLSLSGNVSSFKEMIDYCKLNRIPIISVTRADSNQLSMDSTIPLYYGEESLNQYEKHWSAQTLSFLMNLLIQVIVVNKSVSE